MPIAHLRALRLNRRSGPRPSATPSAVHSPMLLNTLARFGAADALLSASAKNAEETIKLRPVALAAGLGHG
jgi:hypothetical protein